MINIVLADDHKMVRKGLRAVLSSEPDFAIVGEAENGQEAVDMVESLQPDILILDLMMPLLNGLQVARLLTGKKLRTGIIMHSLYDGEAYISEALRSGARAYVLKESPSHELINAVREVMSGRLYISSSISFCKRPFST